MENGIYKMWYTGLSNGSVSHGLYAESPDGVNWIKHPTPVLSPGNQSWDYTATIPGALLKDGDLYKMYYVGWGNQSSNWHIGLATSPDGKNWTKHSTPVISGSTGWEYQVIPSAVFKENDGYKLFYMGKNGSIYKIGLAVSSNGINWYKYSNNPVLSATLAWEGGAIMHPSIIKDNNKYKMVYGNISNSAFGFAESDDGITWTKASQPFFNKQNTSNNWGLGGIAYPSYIKIDNEYRIYYSGLLNNQIFRIGFMKK
jgi:predicted GH43/DUF377 family glycosyl hydrolase